MLLEGNGAMTRAYETEEQRWQAVVERDALADTHFLYGVISTGIFCYPSCPSRAALREHTRFFDDPDQARQAGLRACQRCCPDQPPLQVRQRLLVERACEHIGSTLESIKVADLAAELGISRYHLQKLFQQFLGMGPKQYIKAVRARNMAEGLNGSSTVTRAWLDAGYDSSSAYYADGAERLGMSARSYKRQGEGLLIRYAFGETCFGRIVVAITERGICAILFGETPSQLLEDLTQRFSRATLQQDRQGLQELIEQVIAGIENPAQADALPLDIQGTAFQEKVWSALRHIAPGQTASYSEIAERIGQPKAARAVAQACGSNPVAVLVPCHRVLSRDGSISGYRWGVRRKRQLLDNERERD